MADEYVDDSGTVTVLDTITGRVLGPRPRSWLTTFPHLRDVDELEDEQDELKGMKVPELEQLADELGIDRSGLRLKAHLVDAITKHRSATAGAAGKQEGSN